MSNPTILHALLFCPNPEGGLGLPVLNWGEPGTGKTFTIEAVQRRAGFRAYRRLSPAESGEGQFGQVPVPGQDGFLHYPAPHWAQSFVDPEDPAGVPGLVFVDEINTAPPALQAPLLGFVQLGVLGAFRFPKRTRIIAAANTVQDGAGAWDLAPAIANRFCHLDFSGLGAQDWATALLGGFSGGDAGNVLDPYAEEQRVAAAWPAAIARARGLVAGFIQRQPDLLHKKPNKGAAGAGRAWPSRRTWEYVTCALAAAQVHNLSEIDRDTVCAGFVGSAAFTAYRTWENNADLPDPAEVLDGPHGFAHDARRPDRTWAVLGACTALVVPPNADKRIPRATALWKIIEGVGKVAPDYCITSARALADAKAVPPQGFKTLASIQPVLEAAGISA